MTGSLRSAPEAGAARFRNPDNGAAGPVDRRDRDRGARRRRKSEKRSGPERECSHQHARFLLVEINTAMRIDAQTE
jgi:hypothetical protein